MTASATPPRPRQVTLAATLIMGGSVLVVLTVFDRIAGLHTLETRQSIEKFLAEPPGNDLGLGVQGVLDMLRVFGMVAAGYQVLRRSRSARLALTLLAVPLFLSGMVTGGFLSSVVAAAAVMLWFQPSRDWFDGVVREERPRPPAAPATGSVAPEGDAGRVPPSAPPVPPSPAPRAFPGFGAPPDPSAAPAEPPPWRGAAPATDPTSRPPAVLWAALLTWVCTALAVLVMASSIAVLVTEPSFVFDELRRQNPELADPDVSEQMLTNATYLLGGAVILWSLAAALLAALVFRRVRWARTPLVVSAAVSAGLLLVAAIVQPLLALPLAASVVVIALLVRPDVRAWFD
jgi:hypothetical protein